jgi:hypothetical protein
MGRHRIAMRTPAAPDKTMMVMLILHGFRSQSTSADEQNGITAGTPFVYNVGPPHCSLRRGWHRCRCVTANDRRGIASNLSFEGPMCHERSAGLNPPRPSIHVDNSYILPQD